MYIQYIKIYFFFPQVRVSIQGWLELIKVIRPPVGQYQHYEDSCLLSRFSGGTRACVCGATMELNLARDVAAPVWLCWVNPPVSCAVNPVAKEEDSSSNNRQNLVCSRDPSLCEPPGDVGGSGTQCHCRHNLSWTGAHRLLLSGWPTPNSESGAVTKRLVGFVGLTNEPAQSNIQRC